MAYPLISTLKEAIFSNGVLKSMQNSSESPIYGLLLKLLMGLVAKTEFG